jgi:hypothetical protein
MAPLATPNQGSESAGAQKEHQIVGCVVKHCKAATAPARESHTRGPGPGPAAGRAAHVPIIGIVVGSMNAPFLRIEAVPRGGRHLRTAVGHCLVANGGIRTAGSPGASGHRRREAWASSCHWHFLADGTGLVDPASGTRDGANGLAAPSGRLKRAASCADTGPRAGSGRRRRGGTATWVLAPTSSSP